jgi:Crinkler effector protein N-terminal domain
MSDMLDLYCWALGDDPLLAFPIKIAKSETVGGLKKAIKNEMMSDAAAHTLYLWKVSKILHVNIDDLMLWKVSILVDNSFNDTISQLKFEDGQPLSPMAKLSKVFADAPEEGHLHIAVRVPSPEPEFDLNCSVLKGDSVFSVKIPKSGSVDGLKKAIKKEKEPEFDHVAADRIEIWKVQVSK